MRRLWRRQIVSLLVYGSLVLIVLTLHFSFQSNSIDHVIEEARKGYIQGKICMKPFLNHGLKQYFVYSNNKILTGNLKAISVRMSSEVLVPMESNPEVLNKFLQKLGVSSKWNMVDVMGLDSDLLSFVPRPVLAVMLLFPISKSYEQHKKTQEADILSKGQEVSSNVFYMKQKISNACGTVALVHGVANNIEKIEISDGPMKKFLEEAKNKDPCDRGTLFVQSEGILNAHKELAQQGQTNTPRADEPVNHHFITFIHKDGILYELDGSKAFPINHGPTTENSLLEDAAKVCQEFMARDPNEVRFTVMALTASD